MRGVSLNHLVGAASISGGISSPIADGEVLVGWLGPMVSEFQTTAREHRGNRARTIGRSPNSRESGRNSTNTSTGRQTATSAPFQIVLGYSFLQLQERV